MKLATNRAWRAALAAVAVGEVILVSESVWASWRRRGTTASTSSARARHGRRRRNFTSYHGQLLSLAVQWGVAIEIERAIKTSARFC